MRICQVISSNIPILPTGFRGWGALELIIDEYSKNLIKLGHEVNIKYLNEVNKGDYDIVHIHVANLCIEAKKRGIPYIYSNHDHTSVHYGRGSWLYNAQLEAIKGSTFSICHGESVIDFFQDTDKLFYLPHGVDTKFYHASPIINRDKKLLMVASNGMAGDYGIDRKGFRYGVEAAKKLNLPITIVGSEANAKFFEIHKDLKEYPLLTIDASNPKEINKLLYYQSHYIFLHPSYLEFGSPNLTILESWACGLPTIAAYDGTRKINGLIVLKSLDVNEICDKINYAMDNYENIVLDMQVDRDYHDWKNIVIQLERMYKVCDKIKEVNTTNEVREKYKEIYEKH